MSTHIVIKDRVMTLGQALLKETEELLHKPPHITTTALLITDLSCKASGMSTKLTMRARQTSAEEAPEWKHGRSMKHHTPCPLTRDTRMKKGRVRTLLTLLTEQTQPRRCVFHPRHCI
jgi:hypothetical protein